MRRMILLCMLGAASAASAAEDLQPAVRTSDVAPATPAATPPAAATAAPAAPKPSAATPAPVAPGAARDRVELENTQITGNRELPRVMYVVPWKKPDLGEFAGRPPKSLLDEVLAPVDRDVFRRQNRYFGALQPDAAATAAPAGRDEK